MLELEPMEYLRNFNSKATRIALTIALALCTSGVARSQLARQATGSANDEVGDAQQAEKTDEEQAAEKDFAGDADDWSEDVAALIQSKAASFETFPTVRELGMFPEPTYSFASKHRQPFDRGFAIIKLGIVVGCMLLWMNCLRVAFDSSVQKSVPTDRQTEATRWAWGLFAAGLCGLVLALLTPASIVSGGILLLGVVLPYPIFANWQAKHADESAVKLRLLPLLPTAEQVKPVFEALGTEDGLGNAISVPIKLVGKSALREHTGGLSQSAEDSPAFQYILSIIGNAVNSNVTDLHISTRSDFVEIKQRVDGTLTGLSELPLALGASVINIFKVLSELSIADKRRSQDGSFLADVGDRRLSFRVSSQATQTGEKLSIRILDPSKTFTDLASLGMPEEVRIRFEEQIHQKHGLLLFVGATGAGKSTSTCAAVQLIDSTSKNIVSIEDPIEYQIPSIDQIEVNLKSGQTFESALRSVLRLDADVIFIGEIRDAQTAKIAVQAAQAGQLVLATMHATDSVGGFQRLADLTGDPTAVSSTVRAIVAQSLVRKLCPHCRIEYSPEEILANEVGTAPESSLFRSNSEMVLTCPSCQGRKFLRRTAVYEMTLATPEIRELVRNQASLPEIAEASKRGGMVPLREQAALLVRDGTISINELNRVFGN